MKKLCITEIENMTNDEVKELKGTFTFTSTMAMGHLIKRLQEVKRSYTGDYTANQVILN